MFNRTILLITLATACLFAGGCAPSARLSFPRSPLLTTENQTWYDTNHDQKPDFALLTNSAGRVEAVAYDDDRDGHLDRIYRLADYPNETVPHLIILLDSIPFQQVAEAYAAGQFPWFDPPQKVIAPFPSLTEVCYTDLLHAPPASRNHRPILGTRNRPPQRPPRTRRRPLSTLGAPPRLPLRLRRTRPRLPPPARVARRRSRARP